MATEEKKAVDQTQDSKLKAFLKKQNIEISAKRYFVDAMSAMAQGLFASLLIGTIIGTLGQQLNIEFLVNMGNYAKAMAGPAMAVAIAYALKASPLVIFSMLAVGNAANTLGGAGGPLAVFFIAIISTELGKLVSKQTKVDILVTPLVAIGSGVGLSVCTAPTIGDIANSVGEIIRWATDQQPFLMGIVVSVIVGMALTLPISSAAICAALSLTGLAGGAAVAGCCAQMVGFAVMSYRENKVGGLISQGIGTSMLQMGNIVKNPRIWIPPTLASAITGPIATCIFKLQMNGAPISSGMGTCGFVGQIGVISGWADNGWAAQLIKNADGEIIDTVAVSAFDWIGLGLVCFVLPAVLSVVFCMILRKMNWIKENDLKLN
ncbi:MAG: PTS sugar transporter subunit IIC [Lachnospiraceae bacterium]|nr:PTS sugar transporter subunit IIC [Lachnospiraceae bacterium]